MRQKFRSFFSFYCLYGICYQETAFLKALAYGMLGQTIDTSTLTLSTALVLGSCSCFACNIIVMGLDFIVESLRSISCQRPRGLNVSGCKGELIARVFVTRASCRIRIGNPTRDGTGILKQSYLLRVPLRFLHSTHSTLLPIFNKFQRFCQVLQVIIVK